MLIGKNEMVLNQSTMIKAVQHYFDKVLFSAGHSPVVQEIKSDGINRSFTVSVEERTTGAGGGSGTGDSKGGSAEPAF